ncbi:Hypothetical Protein FCC1311_091342 [Hondaea fermentalgiana]|uniref:NAD-dependent epimerase/dehydratase domain-containing protein n=1 Tax=Hondaea fermentalgiana TaxID=2315210 RepID=A0A2R5GT22_9STRA|nr:Hypothetical Protein FCC1311_091342 [Hondaea fermentalgiana]|eukprot:GBG32908.1 Hypothetical Protein FCC1311_091342 [Hondaea fermentalgiana]
MPAWNAVVIVGAGGAIGRAVLDEILAGAKSSRIVLTSRSGRLAGLPTSNSSSIEVVPLDMVKGKEDDLAKICENVKPDILFSCIGLPRYHVKSWGPGWPKIADRLLLACKQTSVPLIFMDNLYMFGQPGMARMPLREQDAEFLAGGTNSKPEVRAAIERQFLAASEAGDAKLALVRASDFFGPRVNASVLNLIWTDVVKGKKPSLLGDPTTIHSQTFVPDIARAIVLVAENPDTWGRAWHAPPTLPDRSVLDWLRDIYRINDKPHEGKLKYMALSDGVLLRMLSFFSETVDGLRDTMYMWKEDFTVSAADFEARFPDFKSTPLEEAMQITNKWVSETVSSH